MSMSTSVSMSMVVLGLSAVSAVWACEGDELHASASKSKGAPGLAFVESGSQKAVFEVTGMSCGGCEKKITSALRKIQGVKTVTFRKAGAASSPRIAEVTFEKDSKITPALLAQAVQDAGYKATVTQ